MSDPDIISFNHLGVQSKLKFDLFSSLFSNSKNPNSRLFVYSPKSSLPALVILAAYKNNIPYIPIDLSNPFARCEFVFKSILPEFVFTNVNSIFFKQLIEKSNHKLLWSDDELALIQLSPSVLSHHSALAAILFTSGSTGLPKGVMLSKTNIEVFTNWMASTFNINENSSILSVAPFNFDLSLFDLFSALDYNAKLFFIPPHSIVNPQLYAQYIFENKINTIYATPTWFQLLCDFGKTKKYDFAFVKNILIAGEALRTSLIEKLKLIFPNAKLANLYGPTETNVCTHYLLPNTQAPLSANGVVSIGKTCPYAETRINENNILEVKGKSLMLGYWPKLKKDEWHITGDLVELNSMSNCYFYIDRVDGMLKRNGYRIERVEIETALMKHNCITNVAVTVNKTVHPLKITAHFMSSEKNISVTELHDFCRNLLPDYMLPDDFKQHNHFPITTNGKIDYIKLSEMQ